MRHVPYAWYRILNWIFAVSGAGVAAAYPILSRLQPDLVEPLGFSLLTTILGLVQLTYSLALYHLIKRNARWAAGLGSWLSFTLITIAMVHSTGGFASWYYGLWLILAVLSGMFGFYVVVGFSFLVTLYFVLTITGEFGTVNQIQQVLVELLITYLIAGLGYLLWRRSYVDEKDDHVIALGKELQAEQLKAEILINSITDGVVVIDTSGHIQYINPSGAKLIGWKVEEAVGLDYHSLFRFFEMHGKDEVELSGQEHPFAQMFNVKKAISVSAVSLLSKQNDTRLIVSLTVSPIQTDPSEISGAIAVFRDISEEKKQERQRTEFISTASHEMRTPVAAIEGYLALAMNEKVCRIDTKARGFLTKAHESTQHLGELFRDLLAASKSEEGRMENHPRVLELGSLLEELVEEARFTAEKKGLRLDFLVASQRQQGPNPFVRPLYYVHADPERIREVVINLISNAIKFTEEGEVTVGLRGEPNYIQISVKDTGVGIPQKDIPHLFQKFYRVDSSATRTIGGTGLGLFISRNIVELNKGQIWVESTDGEGSTFFVNLPRLGTEQAEEMLKKEAETASPLSKVGNDSALL